MTVPFFIVDVIHGLIIEHLKIATIIFDDETFYLSFLNRNFHCFFFL